MLWRPSVRPLHGQVHTAVHTMEELYVLWRPSVRPLHGQVHTAVHTVEELYVLWRPSVRPLHGQVHTAVHTMEELYVLWRPSVRPLHGQCTLLCTQWRSCACCGDLQSHSYQLHETNFRYTPTLGKATPILCGPHPIFGSKFIIITAEPAAILFTCPGYCIS